MALDDGTVEIGQRIECDGNIATVRFKGSISGTKGLWLGVEWDDPSRGKHDGSNNGVSYFTTSHPTSGSFVRLQKVNVGKSFLVALNERYGHIEDESAGVVEELLFIKGKGDQTTTVEMVGAKKVNTKQSDFNQLVEVVLRGEMINGSGITDSICNILPNLTILNISQSLLNSWNQIGEITEQLPHLTTLNVSENRLSIPEDVSVLSKAFQQLKTLFINRCAYQWEQIQKCTSVIPKLEELHACFNYIDDVCDIGRSLPHLKLLNVESNPITWQHVIQFGNLPYLETLILNSCNISEIHFKDVRFGETTKLFQNVKSISIFRNKINEWQSINELMKMKTLEDLNFKFNPLTEANKPEDIRSLVIAKLPKLKKYNRSVIERTERRGSELDYLKTFGSEWKKCGGNQDTDKSNISEEFQTAHPVYQRLINTYGAPEDGELVVHSTALKNTLLEVTISSPNLPNKPVIKKKIPGGMTVQKFKSLLQRLYKADSSTMQLYYSSNKMPDQKIEIDNNMREISFYGLESGDEIVVSW